MTTPKITKVVLYKHGIASFERQASVENNETIVLNFKEKEMNDVLKSLTVVDTSGGIISSISYDNNKPIDQRLSESSFKSTNGTILTAITQLIGVEVTMTYDGNSITGIVASTAENKSSTGQIIGYVNLWSQNSLQILSLDKITSIQVNDESIQKQLMESMLINRESKIKGQKEITITANGEGKRQVNLSYFIEAPVWKVSYRVIIPDDSSDKETENYVLQAWAIVDNITEESWDNVRLTLISGEPHSCDVDLFNPIYKRSTTSNEPQIELQSRSVRNMASNRMPQVLHQQQMLPVANNMMNQAPVDNTETKELGDLFQYEIVHPVSVSSNQSALVPIAEKKVTGARVAVFNPEKHGSHPYSAILLVNNTGLTLEGGPCSVIESGTFIGECKIDTVQRGERKFIPYATEISSDIWITHETSEKVSGCTISNSHLQIINKVRYVTNYHLRNKSPKDLSLFIEHRFRKDCKLIDTPEPTNPKPITFCIFNTKSPANTTETFVVTETRDNVRSINLEHLDRGTFQNLVSNLTKEAESSLTTLLNLKDQISLIEHKISQGNSQSKDIFENQSRIRNNLSTLYNQTGTGQTLRERYHKELEESENTLATLRNTIANLENEKEALKDEATSIIKGVTMA